MDPSKANAKKTPATRGQKPSGPDLTFVRMELTPAAKGQLAAVSDRFGMMQIATLGRLVRWFAGQSPEVQLLVMNGGDAARPILERMAGRR